MNDPLSLLENHRFVYDDQGCKGKCSCGAQHGEYTRPLHSRVRRSYEDWYRTWIDHLRTLEANWIDSGYRANGELDSRVCKHHHPVTGKSSVIPIKFPSWREPRYQCLRCLAWCIAEDAQDWPITAPKDLPTLAREFCEGILVINDGSVDAGMRRIGTERFKSAFEDVTDYAKRAITRKA